MEIKNRVGFIDDIIAEPFMAKRGNVPFPEGPGLVVEVYDGGK